MNLDYFKDQICDELMGAKCYIKKALEVRAMSPQWAKSFVEMSDAEMNHASTLFRMFEEYHDKLHDSYGEKMPKYLSDLSDEIMERYAELSATVKSLRSMYQ